MPAYTLSARQTSMFQEVVDIYRPSVTTNGSRMYTLVSTGVPAMFWPTDNIDKLQGATELKVWNIETSDRWHFHTAEDIRTDDVIHVTTNVRAEPHSWHTAQGESKNLNRRAKTQQVYVAPRDPIDSNQFVGGVHGTLP